jgi:hypothetical protein
MLGSGPMALRGVFVMFRRLGMSFLRHASSPWFELRCRVNAVASSSFRLNGASLPQIISSASTGGWFIGT